jgi:rare lipoprotein A
MRRLIAALVLCLLNIPVLAEECVASVYAVGGSSQRGTNTASGTPLNDNALTAAHKSLPFGSTVKVTNKKNGHAVTVTITDRGPYVKGRCIDLSNAGANFAQRGKAGAKALAARAKKLSELAGALPWVGQAFTKARSLYFSWILQASAARPAAPDRSWGVARVL